MDVNNPVREMWDQAQLAWGPEPLEGRVKCLVPIGTGVPSLKPFRDDVLSQWKKWRENLSVVFELRSVKSIYALERSEELRPIRPSKVNTRV
jgi:hypothetical protein